MKKIVSWNVNGIRAACRAGFVDWLQSSEADVVCLQEIKADVDQFPEELLQLGYQLTVHSAEKKGYSGVANLVRSSHQFKASVGIGDPEIDCQGRVLISDFDGLVLLNAYFPNSQRDHSRLNYKLYFLEKMRDLLRDLDRQGRAFLLCGDFNIAHTEIDLKNPKSNQKNAGFLPEERAWMDQVIEDGFSDVFRSRYPDSRDEYTWWSYRPGVREKNIGWRLDMFLANERALKLVDDIKHEGGVYGSDHCPVTVTLSGV